MLHLLNALTRVIQFVRMHERKSLINQIARLRQFMSDQNLELIPDYEQRIAVLKDLRFIDENSTVLLKGRVACEVSGGNSRAFNNSNTSFVD